VVWFTSKENEKKEETSFDIFMGLTPPIPPPPPPPHPFSLPLYSLLLPSFEKKATI
jgi:hypothetical protein